MMKKLNAKKIITMFIMLVVVSFTISSGLVYADGDTPTYESGTNEGGGDPISQAFNWGKGGSYQNEIAGAVNTFLKGTMMKIINVVGTLVITIATIVLGIRYILGSVDQKVQVKESLMNLLVACILFFGWTNIQSLLFSGTTLFIYTDITSTNGTQAVARRIFTVFRMGAEIVAIIAIFYIGIKYILAGAEGKAELKAKSWMFIIGIIMIFATFNLLNFVSDLILQVTNPGITTI